MNRVKVAYQGVPGAYSHIAANYLFPKAKLLGFDSFKKVFEALDRGQATFAVLPFDNTLVGSIYQVYDLLFESKTKIRGEVSLKIDHNLLGRGELKQIKNVYSHPRALEQCKSFFDNNTKLEQLAYEDTAAAAKYVSKQKDKTLAAIASLHAAKLYGLNVLSDHIQSDNQNYTRFVIIGKRNHIKQANKTSIVFVAAHKPGSLLECLKPFAQGHLNLTKIQSRPLVGSPWSYLFYLDFEHPVDDGVIKNVLAQVKPHTHMLRKLGTYQSGPTLKEIMVGLTPSIAVL